VNYVAKKKILLVEDDVAIRDVYQQVLEEAGFVISIASNGQEGLEALKDQPFDLIFLDILMPILNGVQMLEAMKASEVEIKHGPIIVLTNLSHGKQVHRAIELGAAGVITKAEIYPDDLIKLANKYIGY